MVLSSVLVLVAGCGPEDALGGDAGADASMAGADGGSGTDGGSVGSGTDAGVADAGTAGALDAGPLDAGVSPVDAGRPDAGRPSRLVTVCLTGAVDQTSGSNDYFSDICDELLALDAGVVKSCSGSTCYSSFATFPSDTADAVLEPVIAALDENHDGRVTAADGPTTLNVIGFSWGGVNAADLSSRVRADSRVAPAAFTHRLIVMEAYQLGVSGVPVPQGVDGAWSFRRSVVPSTDCSSGAFLGPYVGVPIRCASSQRCFDYDFSLAPNTFFNGFYGRDVGHCAVPRAAHPYVVDLALRGATSRTPPPSVPVTP